MSDDTPTPPKRRKRVSKVDMSDVGPPPSRKDDPEGFRAWSREYTRRYRMVHRETINEKNRVYREENREKVLMMHRESYWRNREQNILKMREWKRKNRSAVREYSRKYSAEHPELREKAKKRWKDWYQENKQRHIENGRKYVKRNRERCRGYKRKWQKNHPENRNKNWRIRRARENGAYIPLTVEEQKQADALYVQRDILTETTGIEHHVDHIVPLSKGGIDHPINLRVITWEENVSKGSKLIPDAMPLIPLIEALKKERQGWLNSEQGNLRDLFNDETETGT